jgi:hypothetical protein
MVTVPASVWRTGSVGRALTTGGCVGVFFGALALLDSGIPLVAAIVFVILGAGYGIWTARRMARYWPGARELTGAERVTVVRAARRGELVGDSRLARSVVDYSRGLHAAAEEARPYRWLLWFVLAVAAVLALWDTVYGSTRDAVASCVYLALLVIELFWWPKRQAQLLSNAERAAETARRSHVSTPSRRPT